MASLYIHIPFCHHKCIYCDFYSIAQHFDKTRYVNSLIKEIEHRNNFLSSPISTIYFGGGTPSKLSLDLLQQIFVSIQRNFVLENSFFNIEKQNKELFSQMEITFEANPEDITIEYAQGLKNIGINRISLGVQSFSDKDLKLLNRSHNSETAINAIEILKRVGFENISIDLISNLPYTNLALWQKNLEIFLSYNLPHISCYTLMREDGTMLDTLLKRKKLSLLTEEESLKQMNYTIDLLEQNGYIHYETSSFAKAGFESKHNKAYWTFQPYLGIGAGAHSYKKNLRLWNENDVFAYVKRIENDDFSFSNRMETLTEKDKYNEYVMLSSRMKDGLKKDYVQKHFPQYYIFFLKNIDKCIKEELLNEDLSLTIKGWQLQDRIILNLATE